MTALAPGYYLWVPTPKEEAMKVQAKSPCSSPMYVVVEESPNYYIAKDSNGFLINLHKSDYEPVQEWVPLYSTFIALDTSGYDLRAVNDGGVLTVEGKRKR